MGDATCSIPACPKGGPLRRGWCSMHHRRFLVHGTPLWEPPTLAERFWAKVDKNGPVPQRRPELGPCWLWGGAKANGYGRFNVAARRQKAAHVVAYELEIGPVPDGLELDHMCLVKTCVRPGHTQPVTHAENLRRADQAYGIRTAKTHCPKNHEYTTENTYLIPSGGRGCRACKRDYSREYRLRKEEAA